MTGEADASYLSQACKAELAAAHQAMQNELKSARKTLRKPALQFTKVSQEEYLYVSPPYPCLPPKLTSARSYTDSRSKSPK